MARSSSPFAAELEALVKPLRFAARDDFAHLERVQHLDATVAAAAERARRLAVPFDAHLIFERVHALFASVNAVAQAATSTRAERVAQALALLVPLCEPDYAERALARPLAKLPGVGPRRAELLVRRGVRCVGDLLFALPARYDDRRSLVSVGALEVGRRATFEAEVLLADFVPYRGRRGFQRVFQAVVGDATGTVQLKWFRGGETLQKQVSKGAHLLVTGDVRRYRFQKELLHPEVEVLQSAATRASDVKTTKAAASKTQAVESTPSEVKTAKTTTSRTQASETSALQAIGTRREIVADYPALEGVHPRAVRRLVLAAVESYADLVSGYLPEGVARARKLPSVAAALREVHLPKAESDVENLRRLASPAHERLILEELYLLEVGLALRRAVRAREAGIAVPEDADADAAAENSLPFRLTPAQQRTWSEIRADLAKPHPMHRLLQGDVGSGKTAVAYLAAVAAARAGKQAALMAPTELLAEQHYRTLCGLAELKAGAAPLVDPKAGSTPSANSKKDFASLRIVLLTASLSSSDAKAARRALACGEIDLVVGTHALLQEDVAFARLALAVVDEQHRFGVLQRAALIQKGESGRVPHVLVMTATPIPRTLALTIFGDLDLSIIDELPPGRRPVHTELLREGEGPRVVREIREVTARGEQVYVVYPLVEETENSDLRAASESAERIRRAFPELRVELVHGRLETEERMAAMARFEGGESQILVSTTVIEVGVDVPNATLMVVEHAERFGLAQLHQLRGRVGRGARSGICLLVARGSSDESEARLAAMLETTDGFAIADADLRIRGPGDFLGTRQHGRLPELRIANLLRDARLVSLARETALAAVRRDPDLRRHPELRHAIESRWGERLALADVG